MKTARHVLPEIGFLVCLIGLTACTPTKPSFPIQGNPAPPERVLAFHQPRLGQTASLVLVRENDGKGRACYMAVYLNSQLAARLEPNEWVRFYVKPWPLQLRLDKDPIAPLSICGGQGTQPFQKELQLHAGKTLLLRASLN